MIDRGRQGRDEGPTGIDPFGRAPGPADRSPDSDPGRYPGPGPGPDRYLDRYPGSGPGPGPGPDRYSDADRSRRPAAAAGPTGIPAASCWPTCGPAAICGPAASCGPSCGPAASCRPAATGSTGIPTGSAPTGTAPIRAPSAAPPDPGAFGPAPWTPGAPVPSRRPTWALLLMAVTAGVLVAGAIVAGERLLAGRSAADESLEVPVPAGWQRVIAAPGSTAGGVSLSGVATTGGYTCQGRRHSRATVGHSFVVRGDGVTARTEDAARDFGPMFARSFYGTEAGAGPATPITVGDRTGAVSEVRVAPPDGCAVAGSVTVVALPTDRRGPRGAPGVLLLVLQRDTHPGPDGPTPVTEQSAGALLDTVRVVPRPVPGGG